jgi:glutathione S-transferase
VAQSYVSVEDAIALPGLRIAFSQGLPAPWGEAVRAIFNLKKIPYTAVAQQPGGDNAALQRWTGQCSAPVAMFETERVRCRWDEMLLLAERLGPEPRLIPLDEEDRVTLFGLCHALCGEDGLGWNLRILLFDDLERSGAFPVALMKARYTDPTPLARARQRARSIISMLARRLAAQQAAGRDYFVGNAVSAADIYWTTFSNLLCAMSADICPMPAFYRDCAEFGAAQLDAPLPAILIDHRERIVRRYFCLPMWF